MNVNHKNTHKLLGVTQYSMGLGSGDRLGITENEIMRICPLNLGQSSGPASSNEAPCFKYADNTFHALWLILACSLW